MFNGEEIQCYKIRRVLDMDGGDSCTTLQMYLILLNCTGSTKTVQVHKWLGFLCIFHHNEKIGKRRREQTGWSVGGIQINNILQGNSYFIFLKEE